MPFVNIRIYEGHARTRRRYRPRVTEAICDVTKLRQGGVGLIEDIARPTGTWPGSPGADGEVSVSIRARSPAWSVPRRARADRDGLPVH